MQSYCMWISPAIKPSIMLFPQVKKIKYSHYLNFYINPTGAVMDCYYVPGTSVMCPNLWLINTRHHILFIISDAARAAITAWPLPLWDLITEPCMSHSIYYLRTRSTNVGHLPETACGRESLPPRHKWTWSCREQLNFALMQILLFVIIQYLGVLSVSATRILQYGCWLKFRLDLRNGRRENSPAGVSPLELSIILHDLHQMEFVLLSWNCRNFRCYDVRGIAHCDVPTVASFILLLNCLTHNLSTQFTLTALIDKKYALITSKKVSASGFCRSVLI